jgi:hypothetical protein
MKNIRLSPADARTWRSNTPVLVDEKGERVRDITLAETQMMNELQKKARHTRQPMTADVVEGGVSTDVVVSFTEVAPRTLAMKTFIGGYEVIEGREHFKHQVLKVHGECQLRKHTGQFLCTVREPNFQRPNAKEAARYVPKPESCQCASWGEKHPGRHHKICEWNPKAPPDEQALPDAADVSGGRAAPVGKPSILDQPTSLNAAVARAEVAGTARPFHSPSRSTTSALGPAQQAPIRVQPDPRPAPVARPAPAPVTTPVAIPPAVKMPSPAECVCQGWEWPVGSQKVEGVHHPVCQWKDIWESSQVPRMLLVNLSTGAVERQATMEEINAAKGDKGYINIGGEQYGVVLEADVRQQQSPAAE